jgi:hypothetical protein
MVYEVPVHNDLDSLPKVLTFSVIFSLALCNPPYHLNSLKMGELVWDLNLMLSPIPISFSRDWISLYETFVLPVYSFPTFYNHHTMLIITVSSAEKSHNTHTWMPFPVYQNVINLIVSFPIRTNQSVFECSSQEHVLFTITFTDVVKFTNLIPLSLLFPCWNCSQLSVWKSITPCFCTENS